MQPSALLVSAVQHHQTGRLAEAERLYAEAIAADPADMHALHLSGVLAHQTGRNAQAAELMGRAIALNSQIPDFHYNIGLVFWALGRPQDAITHWTQVTALNPNHPQAHMNLGNALREQGRLTDAVTHLRQAAQLAPQAPAVHNNLGLALAALGEHDSAAHFRRAIELQPDFIEPYLNLALELAIAGQTDQALALVRRSLRIREVPENKALFARVIAMLDAVSGDADLRQLVTRAVSEGWGRTEDLANVAATLVKNGSPIEDAIRRAGHAWPALPPVQELFGAAGLAAVMDEVLLRWLLDSAVICDVALERFLTATRRALLDIADATPDLTDENVLRFACVLARQCYLTEYVYATTDGETERVDRLRGALAAALASGAAASPLSLAVVAAYGPLHALSGVDALLGRPLPGAVTGLIEQQVREPREEALARASIRQLTPIEDDVSRLVRDQYEQNPYPRWLTVGEPPKYDSLNALMGREFPLAPFRQIGKGADLDILIAGCGTGRHSIVVALEFELAKLLAIDLSAASLGYAAARTRALGIENIEYAQADILKLGSIGRSFDMIQAGGVLHHLGDPWAGWQVLLSLLRPNGCMYVALYSELGRRDVVAARDFIAARHYGSTRADIRACRQDLMAHEDGTPLKNVAIFNDFFTTSECRDLLFHTQEHRMTLPAIKRFLDAHALQFLGFELDLRTTQRYAAQFPNDKAMINLDCWHAFEQQNPYTFAGMYRFWVQKAAGGQA